MKEILADALTQISISLIGLAGTYVLFLIGKAKAKLTETTQKQIADEAQQNLIKTALDRVSLLAEHTVGQTEQLLASELRQAVADGKVDKSELELLGKNAVETVYNQLNTDTKTLLENELNDVKKYIESVVESSIYKLKQK